MPYLLISTQIRLENGPTICGDEWTDPEVMKYLECELVQQAGNIFKQYECKYPPRIVLDKLELLGYQVIAMCGAGQTIIWTLKKV
ncbi:GTP cyclohydrolase 1 feedback regulatory protein-like [Rhopilema esculentum]|uniref:GTP cyclohydrolase 1 feedback regulatory protein-like n=1 Tax=Rhopilema esculentum TaxID=499914 RepID=UPI0031D2E9B5|eukprot:gene2888-1125_t